MKTIYEISIAIYEDGKFECDGTPRKYWEVVAERKSLKAALNVGKKLRKRENVVDADVRGFDLVLNAFGKLSQADTIYHAFILQNGEVYNMNAG